MASSRIQRTMADEETEHRTKSKQVPEHFSGCYARRFVFLVEAFLSLGRWVRRKKCGRIVSKLELYVSEVCIGVESY